MKKEQSFRKTVVGGFNRRDVIEYLARLAKERRDETEALRAGAEKLRRERDDAREAAVIPAKGTEEYEDMRLQFYDMRGKLDSAIEISESMQAERDNALAELEHYKGENALFINDRESMQEMLSKLEEEKSALTDERAEWLEERAVMLREVSEMRDAMERAGATRERLESDILSAKEHLDAIRSQSEAIRRETTRLITETRERFNEFLTTGRAAALETVLELDRSRAFYAHFDERFAEAVKMISELENDPRPRLKEFTPRQFEDTR